MVSDCLRKIVNTMSLNVLIVDDDPVFVMIHKLKIKMSSISDNPQTFFNGKSAYDAILNAKEKDDSYLIFLDINMYKHSTNLRMFISFSLVIQE